MHVCSVRCFIGQPTRIKFCSKTFSIGRKRILPIEVPYRRPRVLRVIGSEDKGNSLSNNDQSNKQRKTEVEPTEQDISTKSPKRPPQILIRILQFIGFITKGLSSLFRRPIVRFIFFLACIAGGRLVFNYTRAYDVNVMYSEFVKQVDSGMVETVFFESKSNNIRFTYNPKMWTNLKEKLMTTYRLSDAQAEKRINRIRTKSKVVPGQTDSLTQLLQKNQIRYGVAEQPMSSAVSSFIWTIAILWIPILPLLYLLRRSLDSRLGGSKGKKAKTASAQIKVKFNDVAGMEEAKAELLEVVDLLKDPNKYSKLNVKIPSGVLLCGPTGTGKTLLARAVAGEAGVPFFAVSASEFVEMFVGRGAARIRELFKEARKHAPCVVFIDEIDSVGGVRGNSFNEERDQTLNQLLVELDGFEDNHSIVLLAATNRFNSLDPALLRPGRLTRKIKIPLPDLVGRAAILAVHLRDVPMEDLQEKIDACNFIAKISIGFSGAELANTVNEAALMAAREDRDFIRIEDLIRGLQRTKQPVNQSTVAPVWFRSFQQFIIEQSWRNARLQLPP